MSIDAEIQTVLSSEDASHWLKEALQSALARDCVDAANDADLLRDLLDRRVTELLGLAAPSLT
ncbi:TPA: hypothetical protein P8734_005696 [Pseudomonas aeruginosa]|nr:hypothetical protein [Pseudomonas aeruginosa]